MQFYRQIILFIVTAESGGARNAFFFPGGAQQKIIEKHCPKETIFFIQIN